MMQKKFTLLGVALLSATMLNAMKFETLGYKSVAMGGAAVASSSGSLATYNNPALLAKSRYDVEISLGGGDSYEDFGASASVKALDNSGFLDAIDRVSGDITNISQSDINTILKGKNIVLGMDGDAVSVNPQGYVAAQIYGFGFGVFGSSEVVGTAKVDQAHNLLMIEDTANPGNYVTINDDGTTTTSTNTALYQAQSIEYALNNGLTYIDVAAILVAEVPVGYGHKFELSGGNLMVGGALKYMRGYTYTEPYKIDNSGNVDSGSGKKDQTSSTFGVDVGVAFEPAFAKDLTLALVAKDLNSPEFDVVDGTKVKVKPMYRVGVAYNIFDSLEIAADYDISANETFVEGTKSQMLGGGLNWHPASWFALRGGLMQNMDANDKAGLIYTAGLGFGLKWLQLDVSGQYASNSTTVDGQTVPEYAKINVALISRW
ncbi:MAG: conjugal transfer protein TraF [Epsilonproteobacteria bacterium]|nr:conjugal transfer protein TraF [Campylobacterota bacterium]